MSTAGERFEPSDVADLGHQGHRHQQADAGQVLEGFDAWIGLGPGPQLSLEAGDHGLDGAEVAAAHGVYRSWLYELLARYRQGARTG